MSCYFWRGGFCVCDAILTDIEKIELWCVTANDVKRCQAEQKDLENALKY